MLGDPMPAGVLARIGSGRLRHGDAVTALAVSPDGKWLASSSRWESFISVWATDSGKLRRRLPATGVVKMAFAPNGDTLAVIVATSAFTGEILVDCWDIATSTRISRHRELERYAEEAVLEFLHDGRDLVFGRSTLCRLARAGGKLAWQVPAGNDAADASVITALALAPDGMTLASAAGARVSLRDAGSGASLWQVEAGSAVSRLAFAPDGKQLALGTSTGAIEFWQLPAVVKDQQPGAAIAKRLLPPRTAGTITDLAFSADGRSLVFVGARGEAGLIDVAAGRYSVQHRLPASRHSAAIFDPERCPLAFTVLERSGDLAVWDVAAGKQRFSECDVGRAVTCLAFSPDSQTIVTGGNDNKLRFWQARTGKLLDQVDVPGCPCQADYGADGKELIAGGGGQWWRVSVGDGAVARLRGAPAADTIWQQARTTLWGRGHALPVKRDLIDECTLTPDGFLLEMKREKVQLLEGGTAKKLCEFQGNKYFGAALTPNRRALAVLQNEVTLTLSEVAGGSEVDRWDLDRKEMIRGQPWLVPRLAFAPGGRLLAIGTPRGSILIWDLATSQQIHKLTGHDVPVSTMMFSSDGRCLACAYRDATVLVWDTSKVAPKDETGATFAASQLPDLAESWQGLESAEAPAAWKSHWALVQSGPRAVSFLKERVQPARAVQAGPVGPLIKDLDSDQFVIRQRATRALEKMGQAAEADMRKALEKSVNLEVRQRLQTLLAKLDAAQRRQVQEIRAVAVLEQIATIEAARVLEALAGGDPPSPLTIAARAARTRLRPMAAKSNRTPLTGPPTVPPDS